ncbi:MAG: hypothetical protein WC421_05155 [Elusimicrobiales bacterium]
MSRFRGCLKFLHSAAAARCGGRAAFACLVLAALASFWMPASAQETRPNTFIPWFNMTLGEGVYLPSQGNMFSGGNIDAQIGLLTRFSGSKTLFGLYDFDYNGPSFPQRDAARFQERGINHAFSLEYRTAITERWSLRPGLTLTRGHSRQGANESWDNGLYNMNSFGGHIAADCRFGWFENAGTFTAQLLYRQLRFPNYTDLMTQFVSAASSAAYTGGLEDQNLYQLSARANWRGMFGGIVYSRMSYLNQEVIGADGQYSADMQRDYSLAFSLGRRQRLRTAEFAPALTYTMYRSNQSFMRYKYFGAYSPDIFNPASDITLVQNAYSYNEWNLNLPADKQMGDDLDWNLFGGASLLLRTYSDRPPRDELNNFLSGTQKDLLARFSLGMRRPVNEIADVRVVYAFVVASSNNHYEMYLPCNYTGHSISVAYNLTF